MKTYLDCFPCFMKQALWAGCIATGGEKKIKELLDKVWCMLKEISMDSTPSQTGDFIYREIREITGVFYPYKKIKQANIKDALKVYPKLKQIANESDNRLLTVIRLAITENIINYSVSKNKCASGWRLGIQNFKG